MDQVVKSDKRIGDNIRNYRRAKGLTQDRLAAELQLRGCDISCGTLAKIEAGLRHITVMEHECIRSVLGVSYDDLLAREATNIIPQNDKKPVL